MSFPVFNYRWAEITVKHAHQSSNPEQFLRGVEQEVRQMQDHSTANRTMDLLKERYKTLYGIWPLDASNN